MLILIHQDKLSQKCGKKTVRIKGTTGQRHKGKKEELLIKKNYCFKVLSFAKSPDIICHYAITLNPFTPLRRCAVVPLRLQN